MRSVCTCIYLYVVLKFRTGLETVMYLHFHLNKAVTCDFAESEMHFDAKSEINESHIYTYPI